MRTTFDRYACGVGPMKPRKGRGVHTPIDTLGTEDLLKGSVSRRVLMETLEPRLLLSADLFPIAGTISAPGEVDSYAITLSDPARVSFDALSDSELSWRLNGPNNVDISTTLDRAEGGRRSVPATAELARGTYTLSFFGRDGLTGDYAFRLNDLSDAAVLTSGEGATISIAPGGASRQFAFDGRAGEQLSVDFSAVNDAALGALTVIQPDGSALTTRNLADVQSTLQQNGRHVLLFDAYGGAASALDLTFSMTLGGVVDRSYTPGSTVSDSFPVAGETHVHAFALAADGHVTLAGTGATAEIAWSLRSRNGQVASGLGLPGTEAPQGLDLEAGTYWFVTRSLYGAESAHGFAITPTGPFAGTPANLTVASAALGDLLEGTLTATDQLQRYDFTVTGDKSVYVEVLALDRNVDFRIEGRSETLLNHTAAGYGLFRRYALELTPGQYSVVVRGGTDAAESYRLRLLDTATAAPYTPGDPLVIDLGADHAVAQRTVALKAGDRVFFNTTLVEQSIGSRFDYDVRLISPTGELFTAFDNRAVQRRPLCGAVLREAPLTARPGGARRRIARGVDIKGAADRHRAFRGWRRGVIHEY